MTGCSRESSRDTAVPRASRSHGATRASSRSVGKPFGAAFASSELGCGETGEAPPGPRGSLPGPAPPASRAAAATHGCRAPGGTGFLAYREIILRPPRRRSAPRRTARRHHGAPGRRSAARGAARHGTARHGTARRDGGLREGRAGRGRRALPPVRRAGGGRRGAAAALRRRHRGAPGAAAGRVHLAEAALPAAIRAAVR